MKIFDEKLENNGSDRFDDFYMPINASYANTNFFLTSLVTILDLTPISNQSFILVLNTISL